MTQATHTPGPWEAHTHYDNSVSVRHYLGMGLNQPVCEMLPGQTPAERNANARLIAAAPDLLAALEEMAAVFGWQSPNANPAVDAAIAAAHAAIAKAKGE